MGSRNIRNDIRFDGGRGMGKRSRTNTARNVVKAGGLTDHKKLVRKSYYKVKLHASKHENQKIYTLVYQHVSNENGRTHCGEVIIATDYSEKGVWERASRIITNKMIEKLEK